MNKYYIKIIYAKVYDKRTGEEVGDWTDFMQRAFQRVIDNKPSTVIEDSMGNVILNCISFFLMMGNNNVRI